MPKNLKTGWVIIATSGQTIDGRTIEKAWLEDMAANYSPTLYSAKLWPDHERYFGAQGKVLALKVAPATDPALKDEIQLMGIIAPSEQLVYANQRGKYTHTSIEVLKNFAGKGFFYLGGLAVTDTPASLGTTELSFSESADKFYFHGSQLDLSEVEEVADNKSFFSFFNRNDKPDEQDNAMNEEQFKQLLESVNATNAAIAALGTQFSATKPADKAEGEGESDQGEQSATVTAAQFEELKTLNTQLQEQLTKLSEDFATALSTEKPGTKPGDADGAATKELY